MEYFFFFFSQNTCDDETQNGKKFATVQSGLAPMKTKEDYWCLQQQLKCIKYSLAKETCNNYIEKRKPKEQTATQ